MCHSSLLVRSLHSKWAPLNDGRFDATIVYVKDFGCSRIHRIVTTILRLYAFAGSKLCDYIETIEDNCSFYSIKSKKITHQKVIDSVHLGARICVID
jgi:hypothetical protein